MGENPEYFFTFSLKRVVPSTNQGGHLFYRPLVSQVLSQCLFQLHKCFREIPPGIVLFCHLPGDGNKEFINQLVYPGAKPYFLLK